MPEKPTTGEGPFEFPKDNGIVFLKKEENTIAICTREGCRNALFAGNAKNHIGLMVLKRRIEDHISFFDPQEPEEEHEICVIYPREGKEGRIIDSCELSIMGVPFKPSKPFEAS